jgi:hypothetical protein
MKKWLCAALVAVLCMSSVSFGQCLGSVCPTGPVGPSGVNGYDAFYRAVSTGRTGVLFVGVPVAPQSINGYDACWIPSGFLGLAPGEYDCWLDRSTGRPTLQFRLPNQMPARAGCTCETCACKDSTKCPLLCPVVRQCGGGGCCK